MKAIKKYSQYLMALAIAGFMGSCTDIATETPELPDHRTGRPEVVLQIPV